MPDHPAVFLKQEKPESASQSFFQLQSSNTEKFLGGGKGPRALTPILPPQIAIPPLTLPPQHFWVGPENTNILLWHSLSQLKPAAVSPQPWPHPNAQVHLGAFFGGKKPPPFLTKQVSVPAEGWVEKYNGASWLFQTPQHYLFSTVFLLVHILTASFQWTGLLRALQKLISSYQEENPLQSQATLMPSKFLYFWVWMETSKHNPESQEWEDK